MKKVFTLVAIGALAATSLDAAAQFTVDGTASTTEIGTGIGKYQLAASYTNTHSEADRGLKALYIGYTATTLNILVAGSAESASGSYRALVLYLNTPGRTGAPAGVQLAGGGDGQSPLKHKPTMDMQVDYGFRTSVGPTTALATDVYFSRVSYVTGGTPVVTPGNDTYLGAGSKAGAAFTAPATLDLAGSKFSYLNTATLTANTTNSGFEIEIPLATLGGAVTVGSRLDMFAAFTDGDGIFTTDIIPQVPGRTAVFGADPNFTTVAGGQSLAYVIGTGVLSNQTAAPELGFQVYPNPTQAAATVAYKVPGGQQDVTLAVYNSMGQLVRSLVNEQQTGSQEYRLNNLAAGAYLVKLQVGARLTSRKIIVE
ncbi:MAG: T9SS type A sorting domain-containing protein [Hymenobacter sp.]|nr:T9SS type A sorting domain-containing protein [Hymenobacter sp.]